MGRRSKTKFRVGHTVQASIPVNSEVESMLCSLMRRSLALTMMDGSVPPIHHRRLGRMIQRQIKALTKGMPMESQEHALLRALGWTREELIENLAMELESNRPRRCRARWP